jgi:hypothetical protein
MSTQYFTSRGTDTLTSFDLPLAAVNLLGSSHISYRGSAGADRVFVGSGFTFDFTQSLGGADQVYLNGALADFALSLTGSRLTLTRAADNTVVTVNAADARETVVFLDGSVSNVALAQCALGHTGAPTPAGEVSARSGYLIHPGPGATPAHELQAFGTGADAVFVPTGALVVARGSAGVQTLYVKAGGSVDATQLLGGRDQIYLTGALADYALSTTGSMLTLSRRVDGIPENVRVVGGDQLTFADGSVTSSALLNAVRQGAPLPVPAGAGTPGVPVVEAVSIASDVGADNTHRTGDVVRVNVTFSEVVHVTGTPQVQINVGGALRTATFAAGDGTDTLSFDYTVANGDNDANGVSIDAAALQLNGAAALQLNGAVIRSGTGDRALTVTPTLADQAAHRVASTAVAIELSDIAGGTGVFVINGQAAGDRSGFSVASAGDVNGDGLADLVVGALQSATAAGPNAGRSYVVFGKADTTAIDLSAVAAGTGGFVINGQVEDDNSGRSVASAGDVNEDGLADLIVGAYRSDPAAVDGAWRSYVVFGKADTTAIDLSAVAAGTGGFVINGEAAYDYSGSFVASAGDVNGDGLADLIVGAYGCHPAAGPEAGRSYMVFGKADTTAVELASVAEGDGGFVINGQVARDQSGSAVASAGDVDGDGLSDLIISAHRSDPAAGSNAGRSYVILSSQVGLGNFGAELAQLGTAGADTFTGTSGAEVMYGGAGNDSFVLNASNIASLMNTQSTSCIDGGTGRDTVLFAAEVAGAVDLRGLNGQALQGIEMLDFSNCTANTLQFDNVNLRSLHDEAGIAGDAENRVMVKGDASDVVQLYASRGGSWSASSAWRWR